MQPVHDIDVLLLLATALAAKRRPAEPAEILAAVDLIKGNIPDEAKLGEAFARLGSAGLLLAAQCGLAPSTAAERLLEQLPRKGDHAAHLETLKELLGAYRPASDGVAIELGNEALRAAIAAHRAAAASRARNLLVPKPKPEAAKARPGQRQRKPLPKSRKR